MEGDNRTVAKLGLIKVAADLMPGGKPDFLSVIKYPQIKVLIAHHGFEKMLLLVSLLIKDFCASVNVSRNMNEDQMLEAAAMLLDECGNFRIEDYTMMFAMAKRGQLVKIYDRVDLSVITAMLDHYWEERRRTAAEAQQAEVKELEGLGPVNKQSEAMHPQDRQLQSGADNLAGAIENLKTAWNAGKK